MMSPNEVQLTEQQQANKLVQQSPEESAATTRPAINPLYAVHNPKTSSWDRRVDPLTGRPLWPWATLYFKDRIAASDRIYEVQKDGSFKVIFKFTKKFLKALKRFHEASVTA